jgi:type III pantothenate kinase
LLLVIDVGNSNTVLGIYKGSKLICHWRLISKGRTADELGVYLINLLATVSIKPDDIKGAILASVVPPLDGVTREGVKNYLGIDCISVSCNLDLGIKIGYANPFEVGADRLVNAVAGIKKYGVPLIIVDFGTAITLDVISPGGVYLGGSIAPGLVSGMEALFGRTAKLPQVSLEIPSSVIGNNTIGSIQAGIMYGNAGLVDSLVARTWDTLEHKGRVVATGGHASKISALAKSIDIVDPWITLDGLRMIFCRNCPNSEEILGQECD